MLIALLNLHHLTARSWVEANISDGWASCGVTQNGCIRMLSQSSYPNALPAAQVAQRLPEATETPFHHYWTQCTSPLSSSIANGQLVHGSTPVTDAYLLGLSVRHGGRLVTFNRSVPNGAVPGAESNHLVLP